MKGGQAQNLLAQLWYLKTRLGGKLLQSHLWYPNDLARL